MNEDTTLGILKNELKGRLVALIFFGSHLLPPKEKKNNDLDIALIISGDPDIESLSKVKNAYNRIYNSSGNSSAKAIHGPIIVFENEPLLLNPMLCEILLLSNRKVIIQSSIFEKVLKKMQQSVHSKKKSLIYQEILRYHLYEMRFCLYNNPEFSSESDQVYIFIFHLIIVMRGLVFLKSGSFYLGGAEVWKQWQKEFNYKFVDDIVRNVSFSEYCSILYESKMRFKLHAAVSSCCQELFLNQMNNQEGW